MDVIKMTHVKKQYKNGVTAIHDMNLNIEKGDFVFIIGSTGCGKSTLIKMIYREEKPTSGKIMVGGVDVAKLRNSKVYKIRRKIGVVFQDFKLLICDEPTGNLDEVTSMEIMNVLEEINKMGTTIIMVTHDTDIVNRMKKRVNLLDSGRILKDFEKGTYNHESVKNH